MKVIDRFLGLCFFGLCIYVAVSFEIANGGMLLATSSWWLVPILVLIEGLGTFLAILAGLRGILNV